MTVTPAPDWTRSELHKLERMLARGLTPPQMAAAFPGRSVHAVRARITALRISALSYAEIGARLNRQGPGNRLCKNCRTTSVSPFEI